MEVPPLPHAKAWQRWSEVGPLRIVYDGSMRKRSASKPGCRLPIQNRQSVRLEIDRGREHAT
jgi:hypothetical protein